MEKDICAGNGKKIGYIRDNVAYNCGRQRLGKYDPETRLTIAEGGKRISRGNALASLVTNPKCSFCLARENEQENDATVSDDYDLLLEIRGNLRPLIAHLAAKYDVREEDIRKKIAIVTLCDAYHCS